MSSRLLGNSILKHATISSEETISGFGAAKMSDGRTSSQAGFAVGATRQVVYALTDTNDMEDVPVAVGIAKHNLGTLTATLTVEVARTLGTWETVLSQAITSDSPQVFELSGYSITLWDFIRVSVADHGGDAYISDLTIGRYVDTTRGQPVGFTPPIYAFKHEVRSNITKGNELAGLTIIRKPQEFKITIDYVNTTTMTSVIGHILAIIEDGPFYFKWANTAEDGYDGSVAFCWLKSYPQVRHDSLTTRATILECIGFT